MRGGLPNREAIRTLTFTICYANGRCDDYLAEVDPGLAGDAAAARVKAGEFCAWMAARDPQMKFTLDECVARTADDMGRRAEQAAALEGALAVRD